MRRSLKDRFKSRLVHKHFLRFHMGLILTATAVSGVGISKLLLMAGLNRLSIRYGIAVLLSYLVFLGLIRLWIWFATGRAISIADPDPVDVLDGTFDTPNTGGWTGNPSLPGIDLDIGGDSDGIGLLILLAILILAIVFCGGFLIYVAPDLLAEAAFSALLAGSLRRATHRLGAGNWTLGMLKYSIIPFAIVCGLSVWIGRTAQSHCPSAVKLTQALARPDGTTSPARD